MYKQRDTRITSKSVFYYLASGLVAEGFVPIYDYGDPLVTSGIYLFSADPEDKDNLKTPTIAVGADYTTKAPLQLGPGHTVNRNYAITVYGRSRGERDDLADLINVFLESGFINIWDYNIVDTGGDYISLAVAKANDNITTIPIKFDNTRTELKNVMQINFTLDVDICSGNSLIS